MGGQLAWRLTSGRGFRSHEYELVDEEGISRATATVSGSGLLSKLSVGGRELTIRQRPLAAGFDVLDRTSGVLVAEENWRKMTIQIRNRPLLIGVFSKAAPPWWGWQALWSTSEGSLAMTLNWIANPMLSFSSWTRARVAICDRDLENDGYLAACLVTANRTPRQFIA